MKKTLAFLCSCILIGSSIAQSNTEKLSLKELDSLFLESSKKGQLQEALNYAEIMAEKAKSQKSDSLYAKCLDDIATTQLSMGKDDLAAANYLQSLEIRKKIFGERHAEYASSLNNLAITYKKLRRIEEAEAIYLKVLKLRKELLGEKHPDYTLTINNLAVLYYSVGNYEQAEPLYKKAIELTKASVGEKDANYALSINNLASLYYAMGKTAQAEPLFRQAKDIWLESKGEDYPNYALAINNLAMANYMLNNFTEAEPLFLKSLELRKRTIGDKHPSYASSLNNLALCYSAMKEYKKAEKVLLQARDIWKLALGESHPDYASSLINLAGLYEKMGQFDKTEALFLNAISILEKTLGKSNPKYIIALNSLAISYRNRGDFEKATAYYLQAIRCNDQAQKEATPIDQLHQNSYFSDKQLFKTLDGLNQIQLSQYKSNLEEAYLTNAYLYAQAALKVGERVRGEFGAENDKLRLLGEMNSLFSSKAIAAAIELSNKKDKTKYLEEAFLYAEQSKSVLLADATKAQRARSLGDLPDSLAIQELDLQQEYSKLKKGLLEEQDSLKKIALNGQINELTLKIEAFKKEIEAKYPKYYQLKYETNMVKVSEIQKSLDANTAMLEYYIADTTIFLFYINQEGLQQFSLPVKKKEVSEQVKYFRKALSDYEFITKDEEASDKLYTSTAYWFFNNLLKTALENNSEKINSLIIISDGELGHIPFEAFLMEAIGEGESLDYNLLPYLINKYKISYSYSATLWMENNTSPKKKNNGEMYAVAGDYKAQKDSSATPVLAVRAPHLNNLRNVLVELPAAQEEVKGLSEYFIGNFNYSKNANEGAFKKDAGKYGIIHMALHGILDQRYPILSSLVFTEDEDSLEDNFLQAYEIAHLKLNADLVVLSACETGYGKFQQGEGVMSLARSFMYAGIPSLVVSMWQVNDQSTSVLMQNFYKNLDKGMDKAEALRQAKLHYIKTNNSARGSHPAFWASFIQLGDSRPINLASKADRNLVYWIGGGIGLLALGGFVFIQKRKRTA